MTAYTMGDLEKWVKDGQGRNLAQGLISLDITHNHLKQRIVEKIFDEQDKIADVKLRIQQMCGSNPAHMSLLLNGKLPLSNDGWTIGYYGAKSGDFIHVVDSDPNSLALRGGLEDVSQVKKYVMSDEAYDKRENTFRAFKKKELAKDPNWKPVWEVKEQEARRAAALAKVVSERSEASKDALARVKVGMRCECAPGGRRGEVMFVGAVPEINSVEEDLVWVGVKFDEAVGKGDGSVKGKRYFEATDKCAGFLKSGMVEVGDYPEVDPFASDLEDEDEEL